MHDERAHSWRWALLAAVPALLVLALQTSWMWPFFSDDAFISLRYSQRLLAGEGLTWTDGERVEGYSNLLWVLGCALFGALGLDLVTAARALGALATTLAFVLLARALSPRDLLTASVAALTPLLVATTQVVTGWTLSGLEGPLCLLWLAAGFAAMLRAHEHQPLAAWSQKTWMRCSVPFALLCWTRPDAPLWVAMGAIGVALATLRGGLRRASQRALWFALLPFTAFVAQLLLRVLYYGDVVPNTAHVKAEFTANNLPAGLTYVHDAALAHIGLIAPAALAMLWLLWRANTRALAFVLALPVLAWFAYLAAIGGDHFPGRRLLHSALAPLALLAGLGLAALPAGAARVAFAICLLLGAGWNVQIARTDAQSLELKGEIWEWRGRVIGEALQAAFGRERPRLAVDAAGAMPFYSELPALDMLGLCDRTIAQTPVAPWIATMRPEIPRPPGHQRGNGRYVMDQAPDLMLFSNPPGLPLPVFASACEFEADPRFLLGYRCVRVDLGLCTILKGTKEPTTMMLWVALDGKVGVRRQANEITIPAWLFGAFALREPLSCFHQPASSDPGVAAARQQHLNELVQWFTTPLAAATPDQQGHLQLTMASRTLRLRLPIAAGRYRVAIEPAVPGLMLHTGDGRAPTSADDLFIPASTEPIELQLQAADGIELPIVIERVRLLRQL